jgi:Gpi18-like mannosyltransferase
MVKGSNMSQFTSSSESNEASSSLQRTSSRAEEPIRIPYADNVTNIGMTVPNDTLAEAKVGKFSTKAAWLKWYDALKNILPIYIAVHLAFFLLTYLSTLFIVGNFSPQTLRVVTLFNAWNRWDSGHFTYIAIHGYDVAWRTAFFPLFPLLEGIPSLLIKHLDPFITGLIVSNLAHLVILIVLYRLVQEDFDRNQAYRTVLYLSVFPTAFFFAAAYTESVFLCLILLSFYHMRQSHWWLAGLFGFLASLTRSAGIILLLPFLYEYLRQHRFQLKAIRFDIMSSACIPAGLGLFALYCYFRFHDALAFSHAQATWKRGLQPPWTGFINAFTVMAKGHILRFDAIHSVIDLSAGLLMLLLVILCFIGPWKFSRDQWTYSFYTASVYLFITLFPATGTFPLQSLSRLVLEIFPVFIVLAAVGRRQQFNLYYLTLSTAMLSFMLLQFLTGHWIV